ncbi:MAG: Gfo/Idh/MocA family oxidoreductase [Kibdelosporangium sp.]
MITVYLEGAAGIGTQDHQNAMYRPAFEAHPDFEIVDSADQAAVVSVAVPLQQRAETITQAIRAGKHVLADKPLAATLAECEEIARLAAQHEVVVVPAHHQRLGGALRSAGAALRSGRVGLPWNVQCDFLVAGGDPAPAGELVNFALYPIDVVHALLGLEVLGVHAVGSPNLVTLMLDHEHGVTSTVVCGRIARLADVAPAGLAVHRYRISGSHGFLAVDATKPGLRVRNGSATTSSWTATSTVDSLLDVLAAGVRTGRAELSAADAVRTQRVIEAAQVSLETGEPQDLGSR